MKIIGLGVARPVLGKVDILVSSFQYPLTMRHYCIVAFVTTFLLFSLTTARSEPVLLLDAPLLDSDSDRAAAQAIQQFRYEFGIAAERTAAVLTTPAPIGFRQWPEEKQFEAAFALCESNSAKAAVWLRIKDNCIAGFGIAAPLSVGRLARIIMFDSPSTDAADAALVVEEILGHIWGYTERSEAEKDGWTLLPGKEELDAQDEPSESQDSAETEPVVVSSGPMMDDERPWEKRSTLTAFSAQRIFTMEVYSIFGQGIAFFSGPNMWLGGGMSGGFYPLKLLFLRLSFGAQAGPRLRRTDDKIHGFRLFFGPGIGLAVELKRIVLDLFLDIAASYSDISADFEGFSTIDDKWWAFFPSLGIGVSAPATKRVSFYFTAAVFAETNGQEIVKNSDTRKLVLKTPILSVSVSAGIRFSFLRTKKKRP